MSYFQSAGCRPDAPSPVPSVVSARTKAAWWVRPEGTSGMSGEASVRLPTVSRHSAMSLGSSSCGENTSGWWRMQVTYVPLVRYEAYVTCARL